MDEDGSELAPEDVGANGAQVTGEFDPAGGAVTWATAKVGSTTIALNSRRTNLTFMLDESFARLLINGQMTDRLQIEQSLGLAALHHGKIGDVGSRLLRSRSMDGRFVTK
jgi:hypothetical protein